MECKSKSGNPSIVREGSAHPASDDTPLSDNLPNKEVLYAKVKFPWEMYFDGSSRSGGRDQSRASGSQVQEPVVD